MLGAICNTQILKTSNIKKKIQYCQAREDFRKIQSIKKVVIAHGIDQHSPECMKNTDNWNTNGKALTEPLFCCIEFAVHRGQDG